MTLITDASAILRLLLQVLGQAMRYPPNRDEELRAPKSRLRVIGVDVRDGMGAYEIGDFDSLEAAQSAAAETAGVGRPVYIYNDAGELLERLGSWH